MGFIFYILFIWLIRNWCETNSQLDILNTHNIIIYYDVA